MTVHKRKKNSRMRGSKTHGGGSMKNRRGAGNRGGRGMAGSGKRSDCQLFKILKTYGNAYYGKSGFKRPEKVSIEQVGVNIAYLEENCDKLIAEGKIKKEGNEFAVNLADLDANKLLGEGKPMRKWKIKADYASSSAVAKIKEAGGEVIGFEAEKEE
jgi:large subunit ribosomal protein L15